jgi:hypothetical protein
MEPFIPRNSRRTSTYGYTLGFVRVRTKLSSGLRTSELKNPAAKVLNKYVADLKTSRKD